MAKRVTVQEVKDIITLKSSISVASVSACITAANITIDSNSTSSGYSSTELKELERWLSAHFLAILDPRAESKKIGDAATKYRLGSEGKGLDCTPYGQQLKVLDYKRTLNNLGKQKATVGIVDYSTTV